MRNHATTVILKNNKSTNDARKGKQETLTQESISSGSASSTVSEQSNHSASPSESKTIKSSAETIEVSKSQVASANSSTNGPSTSKNENMESVLHEKIKELEHFTVFEEKEEKRIGKFS